MTKRTTPESAVQPDAELEAQPDLEQDAELSGLDALPLPDAELEAQLEVKAELEAEVEAEKPRDALEYIREQRAEG